MAAGRERMIERRHAMGLKAPGGRLPSVASTVREAYAGRWGGMIIGWEIGQQY
jgi:hypothetical protein